MTDLSGDLPAGEEIFVYVPVDGFHADSSALFGIACVALTNRRYIAYSKHGIMKKRYEIAASWPLTEFSSRINTSSGTALGSFQHFLSLFTNDGSTVAAGFKTSRQCEDFKEMVQQSFENAFQ